ncbi:unnamed protein product [Polarella glacialis]|uniref:Uncharacterized protein n=1 Tax=Polarella glacialis TaxID=89957 RepID=A0A813FMV8_POLGL|nr:unnamed protein product [Polarella glacialis]
MCLAPPAVHMLNMSPSDFERVRTSALLLRSRKPKCPIGRPAIGNNRSATASISHSHEECFAKSSLSTSPCVGRAGHKQPTNRPKDKNAQQQIPRHTNNQNDQ